MDGLYDLLVGTSDLTNDGKADLLARDTTGRLWLYRGTGNATAPFAAPTIVTTGWPMYNALVG